MKAIALTMFMLALGAGMAEAQMLKYVDTAGVANYVGSEAQIPEQYRARAEAPKLPKVSRAVDQTIPSPERATQPQGQVNKRAKAAAGADGER